MGRAFGPSVLSYLDLAYGAVVEGDGWMDYISCGGVLVFVLYCTVLLYL